MALGNKVLGALSTRLESFADTQLANAAAERQKHDKLKQAADTARGDYLSLKRTAEPEARLRAARSFDDARAALRQQRAALALAVAAAEAGRSMLLLEAGCELAQAYSAFISELAALAGPLQEAQEALAARLVTAKAASDELLAAAAAAAAAHAAAPEAGGSAAAAEESFGASESRAQASSGTGQNLGRSHDADIRRLLSLGPGHVIRQGYLGKQARSLMGGWRRRWFVLDSAGTLSYYSEAQLAAARGRRAEPGSAALASSSPPTLSAVANPLSTVPKEQLLADADETPPLPPKPERQAPAPAPVAVKPPASRFSGFGFGKKSGSASTLAAGSQHGSQHGSEDASEPAEDEESLGSRTVALEVSTVKLDGDPNDRGSRDLRFCFRLVSPGGSMTLQADSEAEREAWVASLQGVVAELLTRGASAGCHSPRAKAAASLSLAPGNALCADCGAVDPDWASLNCCVLICQHCAGAHRGLGTHVSKVRSVALDGHSWAPPLVSLFQRLGNDAAKEAWGVGPVTAPDAAPAARAAAVRSKYESKTHLEATALSAAALPGEMERAAAKGNLGRMLALLAAGGSPEGEAPEEGERRESPLLRAAARGEAGAEAVALLLVWGADAGARDREGRSAEEVAVTAGAPEGVVDMLRAAAAKQGA